MFKHRIVKWLSILAVGALVSQPITIHAVSKTPILNPSSIMLEPIEPLEMPEDYPADLLEWYEENLDARSYVVIDQETNKVLAHQEANTPYPIASITKILSMYLIYKAIDEGTLSLDQTIEIPEAIVEDISSNPELSNIWLETGIEYPVEDLMYAVMLQSANDATSALMWEIYGNEQNSVQAMQEQLTEWHITNAQMFSTSGAPNVELPESLWIPGSNALNENTMSANDVALMAQHIIEEFPEILEISSAHEFIFMEGTSEEQAMYNPNQLLEGGTFARQNVTGLKSGYTDGAGRSFVATGSQNDRDYIAVAMGTFGEGMSAYWEIEILLDGLLEHPDIHELNLPTNLQQPPAPEELPEPEESAEEDEAPVEVMPELENRRDNAITNFMRDIFGIFE